MALYFITKRNDHFISDERITIVNDLDILLQYLTDKTEIGFDKEFSSLNVFRATPLLTQFGDYDNQFVIDETSVDTSKIWPLSEDLCMIGHNIEIDYRIHRRQNLPPFRHVFDTMIAEQIIIKGYKENVPLDAVLTKRLDLRPLAKDVRISFIGMNKSSKFTNKHIFYAADDVKYLSKLKLNQDEVIEKRKLKRDIYEIAMPLVTLLADACLQGCDIDKEGWKRNIANNRIRAKELEDSMNNTLIDLRDSLFPELKRIYIKKDTKKELTIQGDLFGEGTMIELSNNRGINFNSSPQVLNIFSLMGLDMPRFKEKNPKTGVKEEKDSIREEALESYLNVNRQWLHKDIIKWIEELIEYKKALKSIDSFGERFLVEAYKREGKETKPGYFSNVTGKVHTIYRQEGQETPRMASGDGGKKKKKTDPPKTIAYFNSQNLPKSNDYRHCFRADEGKVFTTCDWSSAELVISASVSGDKRLIELVNSDDVHSPLAEASYREIIKYILYNMRENRAKEELGLVLKADYRLLEVSEYEAEKITQERVAFAWKNEMLPINDKATKDIRSHFKNVIYGLSYGAAAERIMEVLNVAKVYAEIVGDAMRQELPTFFAYQDSLVEETLKKGFVRFHPSYGGIHIFPKIIEYKKWGKPLPQKYKGEIERATKNYPTQGCQGLMMKKAINDFFYGYVFPNNYDIQLIFSIHDEIVVQHREDEPQHGQALSDIMNSSANTFLREGIEMKSKFVTMKTWHK